MKNLEKLINLNHRTIIHNGHIIPIKHVSYLCHGKKYTDSEFFMNAISKSFKIFFLIFLIFFIAKLPTAANFLQSNKITIVDNVTIGICEGINHEYNTLDKCNKTEAAGFALIVIFFLVYIFGENPIIVRITSTSNNSITIEYDGEPQKVTEFLNKIAIMAQE
jgi:hypothetical protein